MNALEQIFALLPSLTADEKLHLLDELQIDLYGETDTTIRRAKGESIVLRLTKNELNYRYISVERHKDFFPPEAVGNANTKLEVTLEGLNGVVKAGISSDRYRLQIPPDTLEQFFSIEKLKPGEEIAIERESDYRYWIYRYK